MAETSRTVPIWRQLINVLLCLLSAIFVLFYLPSYLFFAPLTLDSACQIALAELCRQKSMRRVRSLYNTISVNREKDEKPLEAKLDLVTCVASIVGYREDPTVFRKCLESYVGVKMMKILVVGIDGDQIDDMHMVNQVEEIFPQTIQIHVKEPLGPQSRQLLSDWIRKGMSETFTGKKDEDFKVNCDANEIPSHIKAEANRRALALLVDMAKNILQEAGAFQQLDAHKPLVVCLYQPHLCKKEILFTNFLFATALANERGIDYLWTTDSDTWIFPDTLPLTIGCMAVEPDIGGSCAGLAIHNGHQSFVAALGAAAYRAELAITRGPAGVMDTVDCQPGPCAAFRIAAIFPTLLDWYTQTCFGVKTVVNEDRHLTTQLLLNGWKVTNNTTALAVTDTPTTALRWVLQQMRWGRATHIEVFRYPKVYALHGFMIFIVALRRFYGPLSIGIVTIRYVFSGYVVFAYSWYDVAGRLILCTGYNLIVYPEMSASIYMMILAQVFYQLPLPAFVFWSFLTSLEGGWGTQMRGMITSRHRLFRENILALLVVATWMGFVAAASTRYISSRFDREVEVRDMIISAVSAVGIFLFITSRG